MFKEFEINHYEIDGYIDLLGLTIIGSYINLTFRE
jgi:hypothetical protein